jgi:hypothetical protein
MIPSQFDPKTTPPGEQKVFEDLKQNEVSRDWIVLHSFHIAHHLSQIDGEADFVVLIPGLAVAVLEIKSHSIVTYKEGMWSLGKQKPEQRGPFNQVKGNMYSIRNQIEVRHRGAERVPFVCFAVFPFAAPAVDVVDPTEWRPAQCIDRQKINSHKSCAKAIEVAVQSELDHLGKSTGWYDRWNDHPTVEECESSERPSL